MFSGVSFHHFAYMFLIILEYHIHECVTFLSIGSHDIFRIIMNIKLSEPQVVTLKSKL